MGIKQELNQTEEEEEGNSTTNIRPPGSARRRGHYWPYALAAGIITLDQLGKLAAEIAFTPYGSAKEVVVIEGWLRLLWYKNTGASFGMLKEHPWFFTLLAFLVAIGIITWYERTRLSHNWYRAVLGMLLAGTLSNLLDRLFKAGAVTDFINVPAIGFFKNFNLADVSLSLGVTTLVLHTLLRSFRPQS